MQGIIEDCLEMAFQLLWVKGPFFVGRIAASLAMTFP